MRHRGARSERWGLLGHLAGWLRSGRGHRRVGPVCEAAEVMGPEAEVPPGLQPLAALPAQTSAVVRQLVGGRWFNARVAGMGITPNAELKVVQNYGHGPVLVDVRNTRLALGRREASRILVEAKEGW